MIIGIIIGYFWEFKSRKNYEKSLLKYTYFKSKWVRLLLVSYNKYDETKQVFSGYYDFESGKNIEEEIEPDVLWKRVVPGNRYCFHKIWKKYPIFPSENILNLAADKYETYLLLKKYQVQSSMLSTFFWNIEVQSSFSEDIVLKPVRGSGGRNIQFLKKEVLLKNKEQYQDIKSHFIVQDFIDFSNGYPWLVGWNHDLRLCYIGGKLCFAYMREAQKWSLMSNIHQWGVWYWIDTLKIPSELIEIAQEIHEYLSDETCLYSLDFAYSLTEKRWYLIEINSIPWELSESGKLEPWQILYYDDVIKLADTIT